MQKPIISIIALAILASCSGRNNLSDAYGNFETVEYLISAEGQGRLMRFTAEEGSTLEKGEVIGYIDTMTLHLQKQQLLAKMGAVAARKAGVGSQIEVLKTRKENLLREKARLAKLYADGAATGKQKDDLEGELNTLDKQISATRSNYQTIEAEIRALATVYQDGVVDGEQVAPSFPGGSEAFLDPSGVGDIFRPGWH